MGHQVGNEDFPEKYSKTSIFDWLNSFAYDPQERCGYHGNLKFHENIICESYEEARSKIQDLDKGWYDDHAVKYKEYAQPKETKKIKDLFDQCNKISKTRREYIEKSSIKNFKAQYIGCKKCGSKINKDYLRTNYCPCCKEDMRSDSVLEKIKDYDRKLAVKYDEYKKEKVREQKKANKYEIRWLVKYEYHC